MARAIERITAVDISQTKLSGTHTSQNLNKSTNWRCQSCASLSFQQSFFFPVWPQGKWSWVFGFSRQKPSSNHVHRHQLFVDLDQSFVPRKNGRIYCLLLHKAGTINAKQYSHSETITECEIFGLEEFNKEPKRYKAKN